MRNSANDCSVAAVDQMNLVRSRRRNRCRRVEAASLAESIASDTAPISKATLESTRHRVDALRESLTGVAADSSLPARELAIIAERAKNVKNMLVLGDHWAPPYHL